MDASFVVVLLVLVIPGSRAKSSVMVDLGNNTRSFAIIPDEVDKLVVSSGSTLLNVSRTGYREDLQGCTIVQNVECGTSCTITLNNTRCSLPPNLVVEFEFSTMDGRQNLSLTIRQSLNATCITYTTPQNFTEDKTFELNCQPLRIGGINITGVRWRKFREYNKLLDFQLRGVTENTIIQTSGPFVVEGNMNETLKVTGSHPIQAAYYFVPSFVVDESDKELVTAEMVIYVETRIRTPKPEFSFDVILGSDSAREFSQIRCETTSFPAAEVVWILTSEDYASKNVANITGQFALVNSGNPDNITFTINAIVNMTNLSYEDDGNFTCTAANIYSSAAQWAVLRVKSPLRPLWPALGILGVVLIVTVFISTSVVVEKLIERQKRSRISKSEANSTDGDTHQRSRKMASIPSSRPLAHNCTKESSNSSGKGKRLSSTKPLLEETTTNL